MAHNITMFDMVGSLEGAEWHGLAKEGPEGVAAARAYLLGWTVKKVPAFAMTGDGTFTKIDELSTLVRSDNNQPIPGCAYGPRTEPVQNSDRDALIEAMMQLDPRMKLSACGCYNKGARVSYTLTVPDQTILVGRKGDENTPVINLLGDNAGDRSELFGAGLTRAICDNTYHMALEEARETTKANEERKANGQAPRRWRANWLAIRHTKSAGQRLREATRILDVTKLAIQTATDDLQRLMAHTFDPASGRTITGYYDKVLPLPTRPEATGQRATDARRLTLWENATEKAKETRRAWFDNFEEERQALACDPNLWLAYNSVTKWAQHDWLPRNNPQTFQSSGARELANLIGRGHELTVQARDAALAMAGSN